MTVSWKTTVGCEVLAFIVYIFPLIVLKSQKKSLTPVVKGCGFALSKMRRKSLTIKLEEGQQNFIVYPSPLRQIQFSYSDERNMVWVLAWKELNSGLSPSEIYPGKHKGFMPQYLFFRK